MNISTANTNSPIRYQAAAAPASAPQSSSVLSSVGDFFERSNNRDLSELGYGMMGATGGAVAGGLGGSIVGTLIGNASGSPIAGMAAGIGIGAISGAVAGWFATTPSK